MPKLSQASPHSGSGNQSISSDGGVKQKSSRVTTPSGQSKAVAGVKSSEKAHQQVFDEQRQSNPRGKTLKLTAPAVDALTQSSTGEGRQSSTSRHFCF
jgi:hypothetical protein